MLLPSPRYHPPISSGGISLLAGNLHVDALPDACSRSRDGKERKGAPTDAHFSGICAPYSIGGCHRHRPPPTDPPSSASPPIFFVIYRPLARRRSFTYRPEPLPPPLLLATRASTNDFATERSNLLVARPIKILEIFLRSTQIRLITINFASLPTSYEDSWPISSLFQLTAGRFALYPVQTGVTSWS